MIVSQKFLKYHPKLTIVDYYPNHYILIELQKGGIQLLNTTREIYSELHASKKYYLNYHQIITENATMHWNSFTDITNERIGQEILLRYPTIKKISIKKI